jgi:hypothetical protein
MSATCSSCGASILWAITEKGHRIPIDPEPTTAGNLTLVDGIARTPRLGEDAPFLQYLSHFATCPNAADHRRKS